jgi:hypothetical protein
VPGHELVQDPGELAQALQMRRKQLAHDVLAIWRQANPDYPAIVGVRDAFHKPSCLGAVDELDGAMRAQ